MTWIWIWLGVIATSLIVEFVTMEMVSLWSAVGGIVALIFCACGAPIEFQLISFFVVSIALLLALRKIVLKYLQKDDVKIGRDTLIGSHHKLVDDIGPENIGAIKINGVVWTALSKDETETIKKGELVEIVELKGNKFYVKKVKGEQK